MAKTILAVDDSSSLRQMVAFSLKAAGYQVVEAVDGQDGLEKAKQQTVDLVLTDQNMNVGERNASFVMQFLKTERIPVLAEDLNDIYPRKVYFFPRTGKVLVKKLMQTHNDTLAKREIEYASRLKVQPVGGEVELF